MKSNNKKFYFILSGLLLASILGLFVTLYFASGFLSKISNEISITKAEVDASKTQLDNLKNAGVKLRKYPDLSTFINIALPRDIPYAQNTKIKEIASKSGISANSITVGDSSSSSQSGGSSSGQPSQPQTNTGPCKQPLSTYKHVSGVCVKSINIQFKEPITYEKLIDFLKNIETDPVIMQVSNISIGPSDKANTIMVSTMEVSFFSRATQ